MGRFYQAVYQNLHLDHSVTPIRSVRFRPAKRFALDIRELISFYHAARLRSVSLAAGYLDLGQPTVSTHLRRLEKEMGVQLFDRHTRPIRLTAEGNDLFESVSPVVQAVEQGLESLTVHSSDPNQQGSFSIGAYPDLALNYLPPVLREYRGRYPEAHIKVVASPYAVLMDILNAGDIDMAVVHAPEKENRLLAFEKLFDAYFMVITPVGHTLLEEPEPSLESICRWPLILLSRQSHTRRYFEEALRERDLKYQVALEMDHSELVRRYVEIGMGVGVTVTQEFDPDYESQREIGVVDLSHIFAPVQIGVATLKSKHLSRGAHEFIEALQSAANNAQSHAGSLPQNCHSEE